MHLSLNQSLALGYTSESQKIRLLTESWVGDSVFCPNCGKTAIEKYPNNQPVADFHCEQCNEEYELKSKHTSVGAKIVDGAYDTMIERLNSSNNPNFFLLNYNRETYTVRNFLVIPKHFFTPRIIEKRTPLSASAKRAHWVGCNILMTRIPESGKIFLVQDGRVATKEHVLTDWKKTLFLRDEQEWSAKGWLLDVMRCVEKIGTKSFTLEHVYRFEKELHVLHPENNHVKDKIRQQLQVLRDKGYLDFTARGTYQLR